ncbi:MAG: hypothetical protein AAFR66_05415, partial [Bacteroidota bacterium]
IFHTGDFFFVHKGYTGEWEIPFHIAEHREGKLTLAGKIEDMAYFNWVDAFNNLQRACGFYHQGLVWSDVDLQITFKLDD